MRCPTCCMLAAFMAGCPLTSTRDALWRLLGPPSVTPAAWPAVWLVLCLKAWPLLQPWVLHCQAATLDSFALRAEQTLTEHTHSCRARRPC